MKQLRSKLCVAFGLMLMLITVFSACKKTKTEEPAPATVSKMTGKIDGKDIAITQSALTSTYYGNAGDTNGALATSAALDASGSKMDFFVPDITSGNYSITPKLGTSSNPGNPNLKIQATTSTTTQLYISYTSTGNTYYAYSGTITITSDATQCTIKWDISFKDALGRVFTSSGSLTVYAYTAVTKPKTEIKDPTPVSNKPTIENIASTAGMAGDTVAITGTNFSTTITDNVVKFNSATATVKTATTTKLTVIVPTGTTGAVSIKVANSEITTGPVFTYVLPATFTALSPATGKAGDVVTLTGTNFSTTLADNAVTFNGLAATVTAATTTTLTVTVPANVATGLVALKVRGKAISPAAGFTPTFTLVIVTIPVVNVGTPGQAYALKGNYMAATKAVDTEGNLYVIDENDVLYKMSYNGEVLKTFGNGDITFVNTFSYKCLGIANDKNGVVHALLYVGTGNGSGSIFMVNIGLTGKIAKEYTSTLGNVKLTGMAYDASGNAYVLSSQSNTDDVLKLKSDGTYTTYLKGGATGDLNGNGAYSMDFDGNNNLYVLTYKKGTFNNDVPTNAAIYKYDSLKVKTTILSGYTNGYLDGAIATAQFKDPRCLVVSNQDLYVGDNGNFRIRKIATRTGQVTTIAGNGKQYDPANGNQPTYAGALLSVNIFGSTGLLLNDVNGVIYNFYAGQTNTQKLVLSK